MRTLAFPDRQPHGGHVMTTAVRDVPNKSKRVFACQTIAYP
ncbi:MAG: hypothetical protein U0270_28555 [Labilithrix sp.]